VTSSHLAPDDLEALLYDWHNFHSLVGQQADIRYWLNETRASDRILVLGAGTGRVAVPLAARGTAVVVALDLSLARLARVPAMPWLARVCANMTAIPFSGCFDSVVVPYSAFQLLRTHADRLRALRAAAGALSGRGVLHIDVSTSFDSRPGSGPQVILAELCPELGEMVTEVTRCTRDADMLVLCKEFRGEAGDLVCSVEERWSYFASIDFGGLLREAGLQVSGIDHGYGGGRSAHRRVLHAFRSSRVTADGKGA
jgi:SAM-dependent methyltransferase